MTLDRKEIIKKRRELPVDVRMKLSDMITDRVISMPEYADADVVLIYADYNGEAGTDKLICRALLDGKRVYAPVSNPDLTLDFYRVFAVEEMEPGAFGIREPLRIDYLKLKDEDITDRCVCITPGSVFDRSCSRMGYGRGYYDRFFAAHKIGNRIGLAYEMQISDSVDVSENDIPMTAVVTEDNVYRAKKD